jgi:hypothetical protein
MVWGGGTSRRGKEVDLFGWCAGCVCYSTSFRDVEGRSGMSTFCGHRPCWGSYITLVKTGAYLFVLGVKMLPFVVVGVANTA